MGDADTLSLLIILRQELHAIADSLQPKIIDEDIITNNGLSLDDILKDSPSKNKSPSPPSSINQNDEDEKAEELKSKQPPNTHISSKIDELIQNYLTPSIKQLNKRQNKKRKRASNSISYNRNYETNEYHSPSLLQSQSQSQSHSASPRPFQSHLPGYEPGQVIDNVSDYSANIGRCCRRFITSLFCGCGMFQTIGILVVMLLFGTVFVFYRANEITLILKELNHWKELSVKRVEYELSSEQKLAQINFDLDVDIDKLKMEHQHREHMEIISAKQSLTKEFIDKNTRTVTTTYWNFLTTETEIVSQTVFSEEDIEFFQNNILYYGFEGKPAIAAGGNEKRAMIDDGVQSEDEEEEVESVEINVDGECDPDEDSFDAI